MNAFRLGLVFLLTGAGAYARVTLRAETPLELAPAPANDPELTMKADADGAARLHLEGTAGEKYELSFPQAPVKLAKTGAPPLTLTGFMTDRPRKGKLDDKGVLNVFVGAVRAAIPVDQPAGSYTGSFLVIAYGSRKSSQNVEVAVTATVLRSAEIAVLSGVSLGDARVGEVPPEISPGSSGASRIEMHAKPGTAFELSLPEDNAITLTTGSGDVLDRCIVVQSILAPPRRSLVVGADGQKLLAIGAQSTAIRISQEPGFYWAELPVTVVLP